ncbi:MAG: polyprenyl synthetase, partial [Flavobacteriaceae bacterium]|nr:polyprenyl synthetase [Flavobacteriaceae bacterium]
MKEFSAYFESFNNSLEEFVKKNPSKGLYSPINYLLNLGGKRLRPILVLLSADAFGKKHKKAIPAALAVEIFHNFTLMHDDIMDEAPLRRGKLTVHKKWNLNSGILSGDAMLIQVYQLLQGYDSENLKKLLIILNKTALEVCEGQQYDLDFETQTDVTQNQYLEMIRLKTAVLVGCSLKMGAIIGGASEENAKMIYDYG